ncbi:hypothetical protein AAFP35_23975 [Gordonia sp. CPCC 206044]|uniref:hypothetical protein n=1 Tax=Gordonia sp. CPCC 206044 TaxID=3140793 RepID=UPI003AF3BE2D
MTTELRTHHLARTADCAEWCEGHAEWVIDDSCWAHSADYTVLTLEGTHREEHDGTWYRWASTVGVAGRRDHHRLPQISMHLQIQGSPADLDDAELSLTPDEARHVAARLIAMANLVDPDGADPDRPLRVRTDDAL